MRKIYLSALMFFSIILIIITACSSSNLAEEVSKTIGIDLSNGTVSQSTDSHGGFHGDGITYIKMTFSDKESKTIAKAIENNERWNKLPLTANLNIALYGKESSSGSIGPFVTKDDGKVLFPMVENGYYFFIDRHNESKDVKDDTDILNRYSFNFTIAIYDIDSQTLYYCELDT